MLYTEVKNLALIYVTNRFVHTVIHSIACKHTVGDRDILNALRTLLRIDKGIGGETLVNVARRVIEDTEHRHDAVTDTTGSLNQRARSTNIGDMETDTTAVLTNKGTVLESVVDSTDRVVLHRKKKAAAQLWTLGTGIE